MSAGSHSRRFRGRILSLPLPLLVARGPPWLAATSFQSLPLRSRGLLPFPLSPPLLSQRSLCLSLVRIPVIGCKAHLGNLGWPPHLKILNYICKNPFFRIMSFWRPPLTHHIQQIFSEWTARHRAHLGNPMENKTDKILFSWNIWIKTLAKCMLSFFAILLVQ